MERRFLLLFGSQTGQSQAVAEEIFEKALEHGFQPDLHNINETEKKFNIEKETLLVLVISSTGDGEPPDTALKFWRRIRKKTLGSDYLGNLRYTILGLGDSNYSNFCQNPKNFDLRFQQLGAQHFYSMGFADDAIGLEIVVEPWIDGLLSALKIQFSEKSSSLDHAISDKNPQTDLNLKRQIDETDSVKDDNKQDNVANEFTTVDLAIVSTEKELADIKVDEKTIEVSSLVKSIPPIEGQIVVPALPHSFLEVHYSEDESIDLDSLCIQNGAALPSATTDIVMANIVNVSTLTRQDAVKTALEIQLEITESEMTFEPGDSFGIVCENSRDEVEELILRLSVTNVADSVCYLKLKEGTRKKNAAIPPFLPTRTTIRHLLVTCCDIRTPIKKGFIRMLAEYTPNTLEKARLQELCSRQGSSQYTHFIREPNLSLLDILKAFPSCCPPIERILEHLPRLLPRPYSISSSPLVSRKHLNFVFNIVEIPSGSGRQYSRKGVCTGWLSSSQIDCNNKSKIPIYGRKNSSFHLPSDLSIPMILIGAGTGLAPFIGFLQHREAQVKQYQDLLCGPIWLFFGCRHNERDYLYRSELERFHEVGILSNISVSFSRDNSTSARYVQDNILLHSDSVCKLLLEQNAVVYVCGDARNMSKDVNNTIVTIISQHQGIAMEDAKSVTMKLRQEGRYLEDIWT
ncbi:methionine synthase reductase-like [Antedon mediterranea]|uniref:methionine synthase reductase-like n=1 Tax=Antedon mediterranea TaxID=105859 RepID=UPI003AF83352